MWFGGQVEELQDSQVEELAEVFPDLPVHVLVVCAGIALVLL